MSVQDVALSPSQVVSRRAVYFTAFGLLLAVYFAIVWCWIIVDLRFISITTMSVLTTIAPVLNEDVAILGDIVPAILGGLIAATAPAKATARQMYLAMGLATLLYLAYLHMSIMFTLGGNGELVDTDLANVLFYTGIQPKLQTLISFSTGTRSFAAVVFAALIGIKLNDARIVSIPGLGWVGGARKGGAVATPPATTDVAAQAAEPVRAGEPAAAAAVAAAPAAVVAAKPKGARAGK